MLPRLFDKKNEIIHIETAKWKNIFPGRELPISKCCGKIFTVGFKHCPLLPFT